MRTSYGCHGGFAHLPVGRADCTTHEVLHCGVKSLSVADERAFVCLFGVVFRCAVSSSPCFAGARLEVSQDCVFDRECSPSESAGRVSLYGVKFGLTRLPADVGFWVACAGFGCVQVRRATPLPHPPEGACFSVGFVECRSGRCLSRRSNTLSAGGYLNLWN